MEDFSIRAIVIGVSLFVTMLTLTAILMYFNTARSIADEVNKRTDIASSYDYIMNADVVDDELTGVEVRSLIHKYASSDRVTINITIVNNGVKKEYRDINNSWLKKINDNAYLISEVELDKINTASKYNVNKVENQGRTILNINSIVED